MLVRTGLPTLFPRLTEARTYSERMFEVAIIDKLSLEECRDAILKPVQAADCAVKFSNSTVDNIADMSGGYPYFIQFICKEAYDAWIIKIGSGQEARVPKQEILRKLDQRFFSGRWDNASDRQRDFMRTVALLPGFSGEFGVQDVVKASESLPLKAFTTSSANMMLKTLIDGSFFYRNRRGRYSFAVPLLNEFILRSMEGVPGMPTPLDTSLVA